MSSTLSGWTRRAVMGAGLATTLVGPVSAESDHSDHSPGSTGRTGRIGSAEDIPWRLPKLQRTSVHGHHMAYYEVGSGPPLVLIHGGSGSPALEWGRVIMPLSRTFRVLAPYLIGFAPSDQPDLPYDAETFVDYLGGFLSARSVQGAALVGESFGGWVVGHYALRQGRKSSWGQSLPRISRLILVDGVVQMHPWDGGGAGDSINSPAVAKLAHDFYTSLPKVDNGLVLKRVGPHEMTEQISDDQLRKIATPTLVIWGRGDKILPLRDGRHLAAQIPGARIAIIENSGHMSPVEQPRDFLTVLESFVPGHG